MIEFSLPYPPSVNSYWRSVGSRVLISKKGRDYRKTVVDTVQTFGVDTLTGRLSMSVDIYPPDKRRRDIDNTAKALLDALQAANVYEDDSQVDELLLRRRVPTEGGFVAVRIREMGEAA